MVFRRIREITWFESSNPGTFTIKIVYDPKGIKGSMCKIWLRKYVPTLVEICRRFLRMPTKQTNKWASRIRGATKDFSKEQHLKGEK